MSLVEHLTELRGRIIWVLVVFVLAMIGGLIVADPVLNFLKNQEPARSISWNAFSPWDAIGIYMQVSMVIALAVCLPVILYHFWAFVRPGLRENEQKATLKYIPFAALLFLIGLAFSYFIVFPMAFEFTLMVTHNLQLTETYGITQYFTFMFNILLPISLLFELPIVVMFLTRIRILNPLRLRKMRRYAYVILVIVATVVTPPDLISDILVAIPLILLYELSVLLSTLVYRKQLEQERRFEEEGAAEGEGLLSPRQ
ncbi:twin-arginine translocase subunit TatC [Paenibacillus sp. y28]|uniref:twin-arginine translocase subunit TatC n=1 Tax=Paenibacillus sp. y28 TaxID=3129110 RepID=UPI00301A44F2